MHLYLIVSVFHCWSNFPKEITSVINVLLIFVIVIVANLNPKNVCTVQVALIISGNLSFLNWLTIIPSIACFDDASLAWMFSGKRSGVKWQVLQMQQEDKTKAGIPRPWSKLCK